MTLRDYVNWGIAHSDKTGSAEGVPLILEKCVKNKKMKQLEVYGQSVQIGGKNIYDAENYPLVDGKYIAAANGAYYSSTSGYVCATEKYIPCAWMRDKTYTINFVKSYNGGIAFYDANKVFVLGIAYKKDTAVIPFTFTVPNDAVYFRFTAENSHIGEIQIEEGSVATEYEPFISPSPEAPVEVESVGEKCTKNLFDKDNPVDLYNGGKVAKPVSTETGISLTGLQYVHLDLGELSQYVGKTIKATMKAPIVSKESYTNVMFIVLDSNGANRTQKGTNNVRIDNGVAYITLTYDVEDIAEKHLALRLYVNGYSSSTTYEFNEIMVFEGEEPLSFEPYGKYKIPVSVRGKNIFKPTVVSAYTIKTTSLPTLNGAYGTVIDSTDFSDNKVIVKQTPNSDYGTESYRNGYVYFEIPELVIGKKYRLSFDLNVTDNPLNATSLVMYALNNSIGVVSITPNRCKITFTYKTPVTGRKPDVELRCGGASFELSNVMITEEGQDDTFEPYVEPQTTNVYLNEPLRKIGDYADYIDFKGRKVVRTISHTEINGDTSLTVGKSSNEYGYSLYLHQKNDMVNDYVNVSLLCRGWQCKNVYSTRNERFICIVSTSRIGFVTEHASLDEFKAFLQEHSTTVYYPLIQSTEEPITCELPMLPAKTSIVEIDTNLLPSNIKGKYIKR